MRAIAQNLIIIMMLTNIACRSTAPVHIWNDRYVVAAKLHDQGKFKEAQAHYVQMLKHAPNTETRRLALYQMALLQKDMGNKTDAISQFTKIYKKETIDEHGARAMYWAAQLTDDATAKIALKRTLVTRYPNSVSAEHCLFDIKKDHVDKKTPKAFITWLNGIEPKIKNTDLADMALFIKAKYQDTQLNDTTSALSTYRKLYEFKKDGVLADDAIWEIVLIHKRNKQWDKALAWQTRLVKDIETSWFIGTYNSEFSDDARYGMGLIYKNELKKYPEAIKQFELFIKEFPTSLLRDDAAWQIVEAKRLQKASDYNDSLQDFIKSYPESRYVRTAKARINQ